MYLVVDGPGENGHRGEHTHYIEKRPLGDPFPKHFSYELTELQKYAENFLSL